VCYLKTAVFTSLFVQKLAIFYPYLFNCINAKIIRRNIAIQLIIQSHHSQNFFQSTFFFVRFSLMYILLSHYKCVKFKFMIRLFLSEWYFENKIIINQQQKELEKNKKLKCFVIQTIFPFLKYSRPSLFEAFLWGWGIRSKFLRPTHFWGGRSEVRITHEAIKTDRIYLQ